MKKWNKKDLKKHGFKVYYYSGWNIDLGIPKNLNSEEHHEYVKIKIAYINSLGKGQK
jgi:hypothetical protein